MPRQKLETRIRRDQIAEATLALVAESGLRRLGVAAVARRVGLTPSALYRHYPGKDAILDAVIERMRTRMAEIVDRAADGPGDAVDALHRLFALHLELVRQDRALFPVLLSDAFQDGSGDRRQRVFATIAGYIDRVAKLVRAGQRRGEIRRDAPARVLATLFLGIVQPPAMLWVLSGGTYAPANAGQDAWRLYEETLRGPAVLARARRTDRRRTNRGETR